MALDTRLHIMPLEHYPQAGFELLDDRVPIWRFMRMSTFAKFIESRSLYFCRADLFDDEHEGLPLEEYARHVIANLGPGSPLYKRSSSLPSPIRVFIRRLNIYSSRMVMRAFPS